MCIKGRCPRLSSFSNYLMQDFQEFTAGNMKSKWCVQYRRSVYDVASFWSNVPFHQKFYLDALRFLYKRSYLNFSMLKNLNANISDQLYSLSGIPVLSDSWTILMCILINRVVGSWPLWLSGNHLDIVQVKTLWFQLLLCEYFVWFLYSSLTVNWWRPLGQDVSMFVDLARINCHPQF